MGLHVGETAVEQLLGPVDGESFRDVDEFAAAVIAPPGIALGVLVGHDPALGLHDRAGHDVFGRDQLDLVLLAFQLGALGGVKLRVRLGQRCFEEAVEGGIGVFRGIGVGHGGFSVLEVRLQRPDAVGSGRGCSGYVAAGPRPGWTACPRGGRGGRLRSRFPGIF